MCWESCVVNRVVEIACGDRVLGIVCWGSRAGTQTSSAKTYRECVLRMCCLRLMWNSHDFGRQWEISVVVCKLLFTPFASRVGNSSNVVMIEKEMCVNRVCRASSCSFLSTQPFQPHNGQFLKKKKWEA